MQGKQEGDRIRLLVIEDGTLWSDVLRLALSAHPKVEVAGVAASREELLSSAKALQPDVLLVDVDPQKEADLITVARSIKAKRPEVGVVVLAGSSDREYLSSLPAPETAGWCYIIRDSLSDTEGLVRAIEAAAAGLVVLDPAILAGTLEARYSRLRRLTPRQTEVLQLMAKGYSNSAIAKALVLEEKSVENHINAIFSQLVVNRDPSMHPRVKAVITYLQEAGGYQRVA